MLNPNLSFTLLLNKLKQISLWATLILSLFGCRTASIAIEDIAAKKVDKTFYLQGKVVHLAPFLGNSAYQLEDSTGKIWVVTTQNPPSLNQQIEIKGKIKYQSLPFAEQELGDFYLVELEQILPQTSEPQ